MEERIKTWWQVPYRRCSSNGLNKQANSSKQCLLSSIQAGKTANSRSPASSFSVQVSQACTRSHEHNSELAKIDVQLKADAMYLGVRSFAGVVLVLVVKVSR